MGMDSLTIKHVVSHSEAAMESSGHTPVSTGKLGPHELLSWARNNQRRRFVQILLKEVEAALLLQIQSLKTSLKIQRTEAN